MDAASATDESRGHQSQKAFAQPQRALASIEGALAVNQVIAPHPAPAGFFAEVSAGILTGLDGPHSDEAGRQLQKNIERRAQRRVKNQIFRDIDQALPERFRRKAVKNGAGPRSLGTAGRSQLDVLHDLVHAVSVLQREQAEKVKHDASGSPGQCAAGQSIASEKTAETLAPDDVDKFMRKGMMSSRSLLVLELELEDDVDTIHALGSGASEFFQHAPFGSVQGLSFGNVLVHSEDVDTFRSICQRSICESVVQLSAREEERRPGESPQAPPSNAPGNAVAQDKCQPGENCVRLRVLHFFKTGVSRGAHGGGWRWGAECSESHLNQASSIVPQDDEASIRFELPPPFAADPLLDTGGTASTWAAAARQGCFNDIFNDEASHAAPRRIIPAAEYVSFDFQVMTVLESNAKTEQGSRPKKTKSSQRGRVVLVATLDSARRIMHGCAGSTIPLEQRDLEMMRAVSGQYALDKWVGKMSPAGVRATIGAGKLCKCLHALDDCD